MTPNLHFTTYSHPDWRFSPRKTHVRYPEKNLKKSGAQMTLTSSFTACLLVFTEFNHLYYSAFYYVVQTPQILYFWHPHISRNLTPTWYTWPTQVLVTVWSNYFFSTNQLPVQNFLHFWICQQAFTSRSSQSMHVVRRFSMDDVCFLLNWSLSLLLVCFTSLVNNCQVTEVHQVLLQVRVDNCFWSLIKVSNDVNS
jgi:hypothetical protein